MMMRIKPDLPQRHRDTEKIYEAPMTARLIYSYSACLVMFSRTPTQARVTNNEEPP